MSQERADEADTLDGLFGQYGRNAPEHRKMSTALREAVGLARDEGRWAEAVLVFQNERTLRPDYDVPYLWLADFLEHEGRTQSAITLARNAARRCRRKSDLLEQAAEFALFSGKVRESVHLFALSIATMGKRPRHDQVSGQRALLFMAELFDVFDDAAGARWARQTQDVTYLDDDYVHKIRSAAGAAGAADRAHILRELPQIRKRITGKR